MEEEQLERTPRDLTVQSLYKIGLHHLGVSIGAPCGGGGWAGARPVAVA